MRAAVISSRQPSILISIQEVLCIMIHVVFACRPFIHGRLESVEPQFPRRYAAPVSYAPRKTLCTEATFVTTCRTSVARATPTNTSVLYFANIEELAPYAKRGHSSPNLVTYVWCRQSHPTVRRLYLSKLKDFPLRSQPVHLHPMPAQGARQKGENDLHLPRVDMKKQTSAVEYMDEIVKSEFFHSLYSTLF